MQNINFYDRSLRIRREWLGATAALSAIVVVAASVFAGGALLHWQAKGLQDASEAGATALLDEQASLQSQVRALAATRPDAALEQSLLDMQRKLESHQAALAMLRTGRLQFDAGHAALLQALARRSIDGVWITALVLDDGEISLRGRSLRPELIPVWIDRLPLEPALKGHAFRSLDIRRPDAESGAGREASPAEAVQPAARAAYVEFSLAGSRLASGTKGAQP